MTASVGAGDSRPDCIFCGFGKLSFDPVGNTYQCSKCGFDLSPDDFGNTQLQQMKMELHFQVLTMKKKEGALATLLLADREAFLKTVARNQPYFSADGTKVSKV